MKPYIMIIDDEPGICTSLNLALKNEYNVATFNSAQQALKLLENHNFNVVLLDLKIGSTLRKIPSKGCSTMKATKKMLHLQSLEEIFLQKPLKLHQVTLGMQGFKSSLR